MVEIQSFETQLVLPFKESVQSITYWISGGIDTKISDVLLGLDGTAQMEASYVHG